MGRARGAIESRGGPPLPTSAPSPPTWSRCGGTAYQNPELAWAEQRTAARVAAFLEGAGLEVRTGVAGTGVVATARGGRGRTVLLRVDMDALPIQEQGKAPYASRVAGVMHACGHDGHTAIGAAAARCWPRGGAGEVRVLFSPRKGARAGPRHDRGRGPGRGLVLGVRLWTAPGGRPG